MSVLTENIGAVYKAGREDVHDMHGIKERLTFLGTAAMLPFHEFGMETALFTLGTHMEAWSGGNPLAVGATLGALSLATEIVLTYGVSRSLESSQRAMHEISDRFFHKQVTKEEPVAAPNRVRGFLSRASFAAALGSPGVIFRGKGLRPETSYEESKKSGLKTAGALAVANSTLGLVLAGGAWISEQLGTTTIVDGIKTVADFPLSAPIFLGAMIGGRLITKARPRQS